MASSSDTRPAAQAPPVALTKPPSGPALLRRAAPLVAAAALMSGCADPGVPVFDAGIQDAGLTGDASFFDAGDTPADAAVLDAGVAPDAGSSEDGGA